MAKTKTIVEDVEDVEDVKQVDNLTPKFARYLFRCNLKKEEAKNTLKEVEYLESINIQALTKAQVDSNYALSFERSGFHTFNINEYIELLQEKQLYKQLEKAKAKYYE